MTAARRDSIDTSITCFYHCIANCVRKYFLTGFDAARGIDYDYRRQWIEDKMFSLLDIFSLDICSYSIMNSHYHIVFHIDMEKAVSWDFKEIFERWGRLYKIDDLARRFLEGTELYKTEQLQLARIATTYRERLMSISWFMRDLNQTIARRANKEEGVTGKFWDARFKSQALLDESALLSCMAYVDLNPIRAKLADTPENSDHTSIQTRIQQILHPHRSHKKLMSFRKLGEDQANVLMYDEQSYLELVDWTGRIIRQDKRGAINSELPPILERLGFDQKEWMIQARYFHSRFKCAAGVWLSLQKAAEQFKKKWFQGKSSNKIVT